MSGNKSRVTFADEVSVAFADDAPIESDIPNPREESLSERSTLVNTVHEAGPPQEEPDEERSSRFISFPNFPRQLTPPMPPRNSRFWRNLLERVSNSSQMIIFVVCTLTAVLWAALLGMMIMTGRDRWNRGDGWNRVFRGFMLGYTFLSILFHTAFIYVQTRYLPNPITKRLVIILVVNLVLASLSLGVDIWQMVLPSAQTGHH